MLFRNFGIIGDKIHPMKINSNNYKQFTLLILVLVGLSTLIMYGISYFFEKQGVKIPWYIETPSIPSIYVLLFLVFDRFFWKFKIFKKMGIIIGDDLNGKWNGFVYSFFDDSKTKIQTELIINQSATKIKIFGLFNQSKSVSIHENFGYSEVDDKIALFYFFRNEPSYNAKETMAMHDGSAKLIYDSRDDTLKGYYYSGRNRNNHGIIEVKRILLP